MSDFAYDGPPPGSAEFLYNLLLPAPHYCCPHNPKLEPGISSKIPPRLGFFQSGDQDANSDLTYIDTNKLCIGCYKAAVPDGFLCWSAYYARKTRNMYRPDERYFEGEPSRGDQEEYFPRQIQAGREMFFADEEELERMRLPASASDKARQFLGQSDFDPRSAAYEKRMPVLPPNEDVRFVWRFFVYARMPFYIDILHIDPPWQADVQAKWWDWGRSQAREDERVAVSNAAAYLGAAFVVNAVPEGGYGPYSISEQRLAQVDSYRLVPLGQWRPDPEVDQVEVPPDMEDAPEGTGRLAIELAAETDPRWYPGQGQDAFRGGQFMYYADKKTVDRITKEAIGKKLDVPLDEQLRRQYESELPDDPNSGFLSKGYKVADPESSAVVDSGKPLPRSSDIPNVNWKPEHRAAFEKRRGLNNETEPTGSLMGSKSREEPMYMLRPMLKTGSRGLNADGSLTADRDDFSGSGESVLPMSCRNNTCDCPEEPGWEKRPDSKPRKLHAKLKAFFKGKQPEPEKAPKEHDRRIYLKKEQRPLDPEAWKKYTQTHPDKEETEEDREHPVWEGNAKGAHKHTNQGVFRYSNQYYADRGINPSDTEEDELLHDTSEEESPIEVVPPRFTLDSETEDEGDGKSHESDQSHQSDGNDEGDESDDGDESDKSDKSDTKSDAGDSSEQDEKSDESDQSDDDDEADESDASQKSDSSDSSDSDDSDKGAGNGSEESSEDESDKSRDSGKSDSGDGRSDNDPSEDEQSSDDDIQHSNSR